jgi:hypothetical protein
MKGNHAMKDLLALIAEIGTVWAQVKISTGTKFFMPDPTDAMVAQWQQYHRKIVMLADGIEYFVDVAVQGEAYDAQRPDGVTVERARQKNGIALVPSNGKQMSDLISLLV